MNKILVAIDGAEHSEKTLKSAVKIANEKKSDLIILYACSQDTPNKNQLKFAEDNYGRKFRNLVTGRELPSFSVADSDGIKSISEYMRAREKLCKQYGTDVLERAVTIAKSAGAAKNIETIIQRGEITKTILDVATKETVDAIVVGNCNKGMIASFFSGCTARDILKKANCEAIIVD